MPKILIIEDEDAVREPLSDMLRGEKHVVFEAASGEAGVKLAVTVRPDVILCDIGLPGMDGYGVLLKLCQNPRTEWIPIIFLTGQSAPEQVQAGLARGVDAYLCKPSSREEILSAIGKQLDKPRPDKKAP